MTLKLKTTNLINIYVTFKGFALVFSFQVDPLRGNATMAVDAFAEVTLKVLKIKKLNRFLNSNNYKTKNQRIKHSCFFSNAKQPQNIRFL